MQILQKKSLSVKLCVTGGSISRCPWLTWVDCVKAVLEPHTVIDHSAKGAGNQYIIQSALRAIHDHSPDIVFLMLTNFDKFDMWVTGQTCRRLSSEKHPPRWLDGTEALDQGLWCTGSHWPLVKQIYRDEFFDIKWSAVNDMLALLGLCQLANRSRTHLVVMLDSPVFDFSEAQINHMTRGSVTIESLDLKNHTLVRPLYPAFADTVLDTRGLIGYCWDNQLDWHTVAYGPHPPSTSHLNYFNTIIWPYLVEQHPNMIKCTIDDGFIELCHKMDSTWRNHGF